MAEDGGKLIGWLMAMTGDRVELHDFQLGETEFFDENGTCHFFERVNAI